MESTLDAHLLLARGLTLWAEGDHGEAAAHLRRATQAEPMIALESLLTADLEIGDPRQARDDLLRYGKVLCRETLDDWSEMIGQFGQPTAFRRGAATNGSLAGVASPAALLREGALRIARGESYLGRRVLLAYLATTPLRPLGRGLAVRLLLQGETRRCGLCRIRRPVDYLQNGSPRCQSCLTLLDKLDRLPLWGLSRSFRLESEKLQQAYTPVHPASCVVAALDSRSRTIWSRACQIGRDRGRETVGVGELGMALFEGPYDRQQVSSARIQQDLYRQAQDRPAEHCPWDEGVGAQAAWVLNIAHWFQRLHRNGPDFCDPAAEAVSLRLIYAAYNVTHPGPESMIGSTLATVTGFHLSPAQAQLFEKLFLSRPTCPFLHLVLGSHHRRLWATTSREIEHELWLVGHHPSMARAHEHSSPHHGREHRLCLQAWEAVVRQHPDDPEVLRQACSFYRWSHPRLSLALAERAKSLAPHPRSLLREWFASAETCFRESSTDRERSEIAARIVAERGALLTHPPSGESRVQLAADLAEYAFFARDYRLAGSLARRAARNSQTWQSETAQHTAHAVLGLLALRVGDRSGVEQHFAAANRCRAVVRKPCAFWTLVRLLWRMCERVLLTRYLAEARERELLEPGSWRDALVGEPGFAEWLKSVLSRQRRVA